MATLTNVGDEVRINTRVRSAQLRAKLSGTFNMIIALQREAGSPGSGVWEDIEVFYGSSSIDYSYEATRNPDATRLVVLEATSGSATATIELMVESPHNPYDYQIIITHKYQLEGDLRSDVEYFIDGIIDMGDTSIGVPEGGLTFTGHGFNISKLISSEDNFTLFVVGQAGTYAGDLLIRGIAMEITGTGSQVFNLDNNENSNAVEFETVNFNSCTSLGTLTDYRQFFLNNVGFFSIEDGLTFAGTWAGGAVVNNAIIRGNPNLSYTLFKRGASLSFGGRFRTSLNAQNQTDLTVADFFATDFVNSSSWQLNGVDFRGIDDPIPNATRDQLQCYWKNNIGILDTFLGGQWQMTTQAETTIATADVFVKAAGTTTSSDLQHFTMTSSNALRYDGDSRVEVFISAVLGLIGGNNDEARIQVRKFISSTSQYEDVGNEITVALNSGTGLNAVENAAKTAVTTMDTNDRIEVWIANGSDTTNMTLTDGSVLRVQERA